MYCSLLTVGCSQCGCFQAIEYGRCTPTLPIPAAPAAGLGSKLHLLPFHQDNNGRKLLQECHLSSLCKEVVEKRC